MPPIDCPFRESDKRLKEAELNSVLHPAQSSSISTRGHIRKQALAVPSMAAFSAVWEPIPTWALRTLVFCRVEPLTSVIWA